MGISADELKLLVLEKIQEMGFTLEEDGTLSVHLADKESVRQLHEPACRIELALRQEWLKENLPNYLPFFANGAEVIPDRIDPVLVEVTSSLSARAASGRREPVVQ